MSLTFKFDKNNEPDQKRKEMKIGSENEIERYDAPGNARNLCLIYSNGNKKLLNYSYLISLEFSVEENSVRLFFTTDCIILSGYNLEDLFEEFAMQTIKRIKCVDKRYLATKDESKIIVTEIKSNNE